MQSGTTLGYVMKSEQEERKMSNQLDQFFTSISRVDTENTHISDVSHFLTVIYNRLLCLAYTHLGRQL